MGQGEALDIGQSRPVGIELLVIDLMNRLLDPGPDGMDAALEDVLARLGQALGLDRTFLFRRRPNGTHFNSHEWVAPGVLALKDRMQMVDPGVHATWHAAFAAGVPVTVANREQLPAGLPERCFLEEIGVWSSLMLPLRDGERLIAVLGYDSQTADRIWADADVALLANVGRAVRAVLLRDEAGRAEVESRAHLETTLRALPDLVVEICPEGALMACHSDKLPWLSGLVRAGIGRPLAEVLPGPLATVLAQCVADPPPLHSTLTRRVGITTLVTPHRYEVSFTRMSGGKGGVPAGFLAVIRDLTATEAPNEMAGYREGQFTAFFEMCPHPILLNDYDTGELLDGNRAFKEVFGIDPHDSAGITARNVLPADAAWVIEVAIGALREKRSYGPFEALLRRANGQRFPAVLRGFMSVDPNGRRLVWALIEDITEIRAKEVALLAERRESEAVKARLVSALEALDDGFAIFDAEDRLVLWNQPYTRIFAGIADLIQPGALYDDLLRAAIERGVFGAPGERDEASLMRRLNRPLTEVWDGEDELADGRLIWVRERATPERETVGFYEDVTARRQADRRLQQVVEGGEIAVWDWDSDAGLGTMNDRLHTLLGLSKELATPLDLLPRLHQMDQPKAESLWRELFHEGADDFDLLCRVRHARGHWVWLLSRGRVLARRSDGKPRRISGVTLDVSARIEAEQRLSRLIDGTRVGIWEHDLRSGITEINDRWAEILGYRQAELNPMPLERWLQILHPDDVAPLYKQEEDAFAAGIWQIERELRLRHRQGHWVWVLSRTQVLEWDAHGRPVKTSGVNLDISAAKALEETLARERDALSRIMETSISGIIAVDAGGRVVLTNAAAARVLGRPVAVGDDLPLILAGAAVTDLNGDPVDPSAFPVNRALSGLPVLHDVRHEVGLPDGTRRVLSMNAARLSAPGTDLAVVASLTDITDAVGSEKRLRAAMSAAEAANHAKSDFLAAMSHEMRTPLNGILGMAGVLERQVQDPDLGAQLAVIRDSGEHLLAVINDILDLAKIEAGQFGLDVASLDLDPLAERVLALHQPLADEKGIVLSLVRHGPGRGARRLGDSMRLVQVLHNLVGNAVKFTDRGEVEVRLFTTLEGLLVIEVADTGIGMAEADLARVFGAFIQGQSGIARRYGGTGLGLTIVNRLVRLMGGEVFLTPRSGGGLLARVELDLPILAETSARSGDGGHTAGVSLPPLRVVAAEDNATNRLILDSVLLSLGIKAKILPSGEDVLQHWRGAEVDVLLLDIAMPGRDGLATLDALRELARETGRKLPHVFAVTANAMTHQVEGYLAHGFDGVVPKPLRAEDLARALAQAAGVCGS